jgi:hypothetical protein
MKASPLISFGCCLLVSSLAVGEAPISEQDVWQACWEGNERRLRNIYYPNPVSVRVSNDSGKDQEICVYDVKCPFVIYKGVLKPHHSIGGTACADKWGRGNFAVMTNGGGYLDL